jgi:hypothetical protein
MAAKVSVLQEVITINANGAQDRRDALDIGAERDVVVQITILSAAGAGTLTLEHAASNQEIQFEAIGSSASLTAAVPKTIVLTGHLRFLRWRIASLSGAVTFKIEVVTRS